MGDIPYSWFIFPNIAEAIAEAEYEEEPTDENTKE